MNQELPTINGELLRLRRETRGWALNDLATRACMSVKQIRQLEEGGSSAFYSETVKWTSAKKVGNLLGMQPEEVFVQAAPEAATPQQADATVDVPTDAAIPALESVAAPVPTEPAATGQDELVAVAADASIEATASLETSQTSKTPVLALAVLFIAALAVAAWMRPEPEVVTEPAPPVLQNMATESSETASSPSAATANVTASTPAQAQKPASTALAAAPASATASVAAASAISPRAVASAVSAASAAVAKPASAAQAPAATASAASKPL